MKKRFNVITLTASQKKHLKKRKVVNIDVIHINDVPTFMKKHEMLITDKQIKQIVSLFYSCGYIVQDGKVVDLHQRHFRNIM